VLGAVGNYGRAPGGTTYHLHFDAQVPTRDGWVFVNPYMTLVAAYERLIGARGQVVNDAMFAPAPAVADGQGAATSTPTPMLAETKKSSTDDARQSIDASLKIENEPKGERQTAVAEHCTSYLHRGHRRRLCRTGSAESSARERHAFRSGRHRISRQGRGARHHG